MGRSKASRQPRQTWDRLCRRAGDVCCARAREIGRAQRLWGTALAGSGHSARPAYGGRLHRTRTKHSQNHFIRSLSDIAFVTRRRRCGQMRGRRPGKTGDVFAGIRGGFFRAENDTDGRRSFAAVERSMSDRLLGKANSREEDFFQDAIED